MSGMDTQGMAMQQGMSSLPGMGMGESKEKGITSQDFWWFAVGALAVTNFLGAFILSTIRTGKALNGIRYAPILVIIAITIFIAVNAGIRAAFGSMLI
jgi:hypothetical protein